MKIQSIKDMPPKFKRLLVEELGYKTDGTLVFDKEGNQLRDPYTKDPIQLNNMAIFPHPIIDGRAVILDNNVLSIVYFLEEFGKIDIEEPTE